MTDLYRPINRSPQRPQRDIRPVFHAQPSVPKPPVTPEEPIIIHELVSMRDHLLRMVTTAGHSWATAEHDVLLTPLKKASRALKGIIPARARRFKGWEAAYFASLVVALAAIPTALLVHSALQSQRYVLSAATKQLVGEPVATLDKQLTYDTKTKTYRYNPDAANGMQNTGSQLAVGGSNYYGVDLAQAASKGQKFTDAQTKLSFSLVPAFGQLNGHHEAGHIVYPTNGGQVIYTLKDNGLKEDVVLTRPTNTAMLTYKLQLPSDLEARLLSDGSVGIYSADPTLYGNISYGSSKDQTLVQKARQHGQKTNLVFQIPAPVITETGKQISNAKARFSLSGNELTVSADGLSALSYPISIDPSVIVQSANSFTNGTDEGNNLVVGTSSITRATLMGGTVNSASGSWTSSANILTTHRYSGATVAARGFIYAVGGQDGAGGGANATVEYASLNSTTGAIGTWATSTSTLVQGRANFAAVTYNGYIYAIGGQSGGGTAFSSVEYAAICTGGNTNSGCSGRSAGDIGTWGAPKIAGCLSSCGDTLPSTIWKNAAAVYNGYIYSVTGCAPIAAGACSGGPTNNVYSAHINADGTLGTWSSATNTNLTTRWNAGAVAVNGYLYAIGGCESYNSITKACNQVTPDTVQYAAINSSTGALSSWMTASTTFAQQDMVEATTSDGYLYVTGGTSNTMLYAQLYASGDTSPWNATTSFTTARNGAYFTSYNGYLYLTNGCTNGAANCASGFINDAQYAKIDPEGSAGSYSTAGSSPDTNSRIGTGSVAYNGFLYVMGGAASSTVAPTNAISAAAIATDGSLGTFTSTGMTAITGVRSSFGAFAYKGYMYVIGGCSSAFTSCGTVGNDLATVYSAPIATSGTIGAWTAQQSIPTGLYGASSVAAANGTVYVLGGINGTTFQTAIYYHSLGSSGTISGAWSTSAQTMPATNLAYMGVTTYANVLYVAGGCSAGNLTCTTATNNVYYSSLPSGGGDLTGALTSTAAFSNARGLTALVAASGYLYLVGGYGGGTFYGDTQYAPINTNGSLGTWATSGASTLSAGVDGLSVASYNGVLYANGGVASGSVFVNTVQYASIGNGGGTNGTWTTNGTSLSGPYSGGWAYGASFAANGYMYIVGGYDGTTTYNKVYSSPIGSDGSTGSWTDTTKNLTTPRFGLSMTVSNGYAYVFAGQNGGTFLNTYEYAKILTGGTLGSWTQANITTSGGPITARIQGAATAYNGYIYFLGGQNSGGVPFSDAYGAAINADGSLTWMSSALTSFTTARSNHQIFANNGYLYLVGGLDSSSNYLSDVQYAAINTSNGTIGSWLTTTPLLQPRAIMNLNVLNGYVYILGGTNTVGGLVNMEYAPLLSSGALGDWQSAITKFTGSRSRSGSVIYNGRIYILGGYRASGPTFLTEIQYATLQTTPRVAHYSRVLDLKSTISGNGDGDTEITRLGLPSTASEPSALGYSGTSACISGATNSAASGNLIFGTPICSTAPLAPSVPGAFKSYGRYVFAFVTIDDSLSGTFPDSPSNISEMDVYFHPAPARRLRGGKSTIDLDLNGTQQVTNSTNGLPVMQQLDTEGAP